MDTRSPWLIFYGEEPRRDARARLFCFHYAGTGGSIFRSWARELSEEVELVAVQLPGRENRILEPLIYSMELVTAPLADALSSLLDRPFAFFGHSMGATICFELARVMRQRNLPQPALLIASGQNAPQFRPEIMRHQLPDHDFVQLLRRYGGVPDIVLQDQVLLAALLPRIRADGAVFETYDYQDQPPLDSRIVVFHGTADQFVDSQGLAGWRAQTRNGFHLQAFPGGHFYLHDEEPSVLGHINHEISSLFCADAYTNRS